MRITFYPIIMLLLLAASRLDAEELPVLRISFPASKLTDTYVQGEMALEDTDGSLVSLPAKFKTRGATAKQYSSKPSFNMKLREADGTEIDSTLLGLRCASSWILDAMAIDRICMRNRVCFDIWNALYRLPYYTEFGSRNGTVGRFVEVYINGTYKGIYCLTDRINRKLLDLKKPKENSDGSVTIRGVQYKRGTNDYGDQNTPGFFNDSTVCVAAYHDAWELSEPEDYPCLAAWQPLLDFYDNYNSYNYISTHFYVENLLDYTLFLMALSISDNWGNKNQIYSIRDIQAEGDKSRFIFSPWDLDTSLGGHYNGNYYDGTYSNWTPQQVISSATRPFSTCLTQASFKADLKQRWLETKGGVFAVDSIAQRLYDYCELFVSSGAWERQASVQPCYVPDLKKEIDLIIDWYAGRYQQINAYFGVTDEETAVRPLFDFTGEALAPAYDLRGIPASPASRGKGIRVSGGRKWIAR
ncbi:MAG: CotH kinase family protein [Prevotellaceae bacterium]|nr:CotH kinase family protein [Prevotellaceae bacterium]